MTAAPKPCAHCGAAFKSSDGRIKYCGPECRTAAHKANVAGHNAAASEAKQKRDTPKPTNAAGWSARRNGRLRPGWDDPVLVECWCRYTIVEVAAADIRSGQGGTCGLPDCEDPR